AAAVDGREIDLVRMRACVLDREPRLVGELAEIDLMAVARLAEHADVGAGAEHVVLAGFDHHGTHLRMLEAQPLHRIVELDIDREIVGIELELVVRGKPAGRIDVHDQGRDLAVHLDLPVPIAGGLGAEIDRLHGASLARRRNMHYFAYSRKIPRFHEIKYIPARGKATCAESYAGG